MYSLVCLDLTDSSYLMSESCVVRDLYEDNISTTNDGEVQPDEDSEQRSRRSDTPSQAPSYLELVSNDKRNIHFSKPFSEFSTDLYKSW